MPTRVTLLALDGSLWEADVPLIRRAIVFGTRVFLRRGRRSIRLYKEVEAIKVNQISKPREIEE